MDAPARAAVFLPVAPPTTFEETVARLGRAIRIGVLEPGARLPPERELAEQLGISRSTLRQALATLTETGHLTAIRGRSGGTFVAESPPISSGNHYHPADWRNQVDWRLTLELGAARLGAERATDEELDRLETLLEAAEAAADEDWPAFRRADVSFHLALAETSHSPRVVAAMTEVQGEMTELLQRIPHAKRAIEHANDQHRRILDALRARDGARAGSCVHEHVEGMRRLVEGLLP